MKPAAFAPRVHLLVCANARAADDPLRSGCGAAGPAVFAALKSAVLGAGAARGVWVTRTACLGHCPRVGCAVVIHPRNEHRVEVTADDAPALLREVLRAPPEGEPNPR